jgi:hypothetical protein
MDFPKQIIVVVCGGRQEFINWCRETGHSTDDLFICYARKKKSLEGLSKCKVVYYGNYWNNPLFGQSILDDITK